MSLSDYRLVLLPEVASIERAKKGVEYSKGTIYVAISGVSQPPKINLLDNNGVIDTRYAVITPKDFGDAKYLKLSLEESEAKFLATFQTTINLQIEALSHWELKWHSDKKIRAELPKVMALANSIEESVNRELNNLQQFKKFYLDNLMI